MQLIGVMFLAIIRSKADRRAVSIHSRIDRRTLYIHSRADRKKNFPFSVSIPQP